MTRLSRGPSASHFLFITCLALLCLSVCIGTQIRIDDPDFRFGDEPKTVVIYRLIGNDMPPLQTLGQLRWNTQYALDNEPNFPGAQRKWILNRIWNETEFELIYTSLVRAGVERKDILARCFDLDEYNKFETQEDKLFYLTAQNDGRNAGIRDGIDSGYEWSVILDGNTFMTKDSWNSLKKALAQSSKEGKKYFKIPYHRVHQEQDKRWLNKDTNMDIVLEYAPLKGESQIAFHRSSNEMFTLGDTKPENNKAGKSAKGYGQRNKSYMFKEGQICGEDSKVCGCADVEEGNEENVGKLSISKKLRYSKQCGLILRLWSYPTPDVIHTGFSSKDEEGFFCFYKESAQPKLRKQDPEHSECLRMRHAAQAWAQMKEPERKPFKARSQGCKEAYNKVFLKESCFRAVDREVAQAQVVDALAAITKEKKENPLNLAVPLCKRLRPPPNDPSRKHFTMVFDAETLLEEKSKYKQLGAAAHVTPYIEHIKTLADRHGMVEGPYSLQSKTRMPRDQVDKRFYYSVRPYYWPEEEIPKDMLSDLHHMAAEELELKYHLKPHDIEGWKEKKMLHRDGYRVPGK